MSFTFRALLQGILVGVLLVLAGVDSVAGWTPQFSPAKIISGGNDLGGGDFYNPNLKPPVDITVGPSGTVYVHWLGKSDSRAYFIKSTDKGATWSVPVLFTPIGVSALTCSLVEGNNGFLYAAYSDLNESPTVRFSHFYFITSENGGVTWSTPVSISTLINGCTQGYDFTMGLGHDGNLHVCWSDDETRRLGDNEPKGGFWIRTYSPVFDSWSVATNVAAILTGPQKRPIFTSRAGKTIFTLHGLDYGDKAGAIVSLGTGGLWSSGYYGLNAPAEYISTPCGIIHASPCDPCTWQWNMFTALDNNGTRFVLQEYEVKEVYWTETEPGHCESHFNILDSGQRIISSSTGNKMKVYNEMILEDDKFIAATGNAIVYFFYREEITYPTEHMMVKICQDCTSGSGSGSWLAPIQLNDSSHTRDKRDPRAAVGPGGEVYVVWFYDPGRVMFTTDQAAPQTKKPPNISNTFLLLLN